MQSAARRHLRTKENSKHPPPRSQTLWATMHSDVRRRQRGSCDAISSTTSFINEVKFLNKQQPPIPQTLRATTHSGMRRPMRESFGAISSATSLCDFAQERSKFSASTTQFPKLYEQRCTPRCDVLGETPSMQLTARRHSRAR
jgi:hypothetical protein